MQRISRRCTVGQEQTSSQPGGFGGGLFICSAFDVLFYIWRHIHAEWHYGSIDPGKKEETKSV